MVRTVMIAAAARQWGVPESECNHIEAVDISCTTTSSRRVSYGALRGPQRAPCRCPIFKTVKLKDPSQFTSSGNQHRISTYQINAQEPARFGLDVRLPGWCNAVIARCPTFGGLPRNSMRPKPSAVPGLQVFEVPARGYRVFLRRHRRRGDIDLGRNAGRARLCRSHGLRPDSTEKHRHATGRK